MFIPTGDAKIYATAFGSSSAPAILGLGGWIGSWELWAEPFSIMSQSWYTLAYDHRGSGATQAPVKSITFDNLVNDVFAVLDAFGVEHAVLAAESAGALTAFGAALKDPARITGLVIVDGMSVRSQPSETDPFVVGLRRDYASTLAAFVETCVPESNSDHLKRWGRQILDRAAPDAAIALYLSGSTIDLQASITSVTQNTLILHGEADAVVPLAEARWLAGALPRATLTIIAGAGHVPTITRPVAVAREIMAFFPQS